MTTRIQIVLVFILYVFTPTKLVGQNWESLGSGMENTIYTVAQGRGDSIFAGGRFYTAGGQSRSFLSVWDGMKWQPMGLNLDNPVKCIVNIEGSIYIGGEFSYYNDSLLSCFSKWDGNRFTGYQQGFFKSGQHSVMATVNAICKFKNQIYAGGIFDYANSKKDYISNIARWNGEKWEQVGGGLFGNSGVNCLIVFQDTLYVGGGFDTAGDTTTTKYIAKWDGNNWTAVGKGFNNEVTSLAIYNNQLYAGGVFTQADGKSIPNIARWNGTTWEKVGGGINNSVYSLKSISGRLYAGGSFSMADGKSCKNLSYWDGNNWLSAGDPNGIVYSIADAGFLTVGGSFTSIGGKAINRIAIDRTILTTTEVNQTSRLTVFPNPTSANLNLSEQADLIKVFSITGNEIATFHNSNYIDLSNLSAGLYFLSISIRNNTTFHRIHVCSH